MLRSLHFFRTEFVTYTSGFDSHIEMKSDQHDEVVTISIGDWRDFVLLFPFLRGLAICAVCLPLPFPVRQHADGNAHSVVITAPFIHCNATRVSNQKCDQIIHELPYLRTHMGLLTFCNTGVNAVLFRNVWHNLF